VEGLAAVGDDAALQEIDDAIGDHLRVQPEVLLVAEAAQYGVRNAADPHLHLGTGG
jgi:hypothetical protein